MNPQYDPSVHHRPYDTTAYQQQRGISTALLEELVRQSELTKPFHRKLLDEAKHALGSGLNEMAVVLSQAASEMCTEWAITGMFALRKSSDLAGPILGLFVVRDICNERLHSVFEALSGNSPNQQPFWQQLRNHRNRRNDVVHKGQRASVEEAKGSVEVVEQYVLHVESVLAKMQAQ